VNSRTIRIFVSSTFTDFEKERRILNLEVFPEVREACEKKGYVFQVVDLRYGISPKAAEKQGTMNVCLEEVERCRATGNYPYFLLLIGERFGWVPVPEMVEAGDFEKVRNYFSGEDNPWRAVLDKSYRLDENQIPESYRIIKEKDDKFKEKYNDVILSKLFEIIHEEHVLDDEKDDKYFLSATGQEILNGLLRENDESLAHILCIDRRLQVPEISRLIDSEGKKLGEQNTLKERVKKCYEDAGKQENYVVLDCPTTNCEPDEYKKKEKDYDNSFREATKKALLKLVEDTMNREKESDADEEVTAHKVYLDECMDICVGRRNLIERGMEYISCSDTSQPLIFHGPRGMGKTKVMASMINEVVSRYEDDSNIHIIYRFVGATTKSSDSFSLVNELDRQLCELCNISRKESSSYSAVCANFDFHLSQIDKNKKIFILVDAVDQLVSFENENVLAWIPGKLPSNVKIIISTRDDISAEDSMTGEAEYYLSLATKRAANPEKIYDVPIDKLSDEDVEVIVQKMLGKYNRKLTAAQIEKVINAYSNEGLAIFLKVIVGYLRKIPSYDNDFELEKTLKDVTNSFVRELEELHGKELVKSFFGYLMVSKYGLMEREILDLFYDNDRIKAEYSETFPDSPPLENTQRFPFMVWSRFYHGLEPYLKQINWDGHELLYFYHLGIRDIIYEKYFLDNGSQNDFGRICRSEMAKYFEKLAIWYDERTKVCNVRKLDELPYQYMELGDYNDLKRLLENCDYIQAKLNSNQLYQLINEAQFVCERTDKDIDGMIQLIFAEVVRYNDDAGKGYSNCFEDIHTLTIFKENHIFNEKFFELGTKKDALSELLSRYGVTLKNENGIDYVLLQCSLKVAARIRRYGNLDEAIEAAGISEAAMETFLSKEENRSSAIYDDYSRLKYDMAFIHFYRGEKEAAGSLMLESVELEKKAGNPVGAAMSFAEYLNERMLMGMSDAENNKSDDYIKYADELVENNMGKALDPVTGEAIPSNYEVLSKASSENLNARRWVANIIMHSMQAAFLVNPEDDRINRLYKQFETNDHVMNNLSNVQKKPFAAIYDMSNKNYRDAQVKMQTYIGEMLKTGKENTGEIDITGEESMLNAVKKDAFSKNYWLLARAYELAGENVILRDYLDNYFNNKNKALKKLSDAGIKVESRANQYYDVLMKDMLDRTAGAF
jgi:DNA polymerase III delta prime subunit